MKNLEIILKRVSRRRAIREKCRNCSGWHTGDVIRCRHQDCPLHVFRTGKGKQEPKQRSQAIKNSAFGVWAGERARSTNACLKAVLCFRSGKELWESQARMVQFLKKRPYRASFLEK